MLGKAEEVLRSGEKQVRGFQLKLAALLKLWGAVKAAETETAFTAEIRCALGTEGGKAASPPPGPNEDCCCC